MKTLLSERTRTPWLASLLSGLLAILIPIPAFAQAMPWENPLRQVLVSLQGPTAQIFIILGIVVAGLCFTVGEAGSVFRRSAAVVMGGAIAAGASTWAPTLFGF